MPHAPQVPNLNLDQLTAATGILSDIFHATLVPLQQHFQPTIFAMASFPLFPLLPVELQLAIWAYAVVPDPEPEVCVVCPLFLTPDEKPTHPFIVDTAWPAAIHVCRTAREAVFASGALRLRYSPVAGFAVPYRHFLPDIDTLYINQSQVFLVSRLFSQEFARGLRHLAVEVAGMESDYDRLPLMIRRRAIFLRTLSIVFASTASPNVVPPRTPTFRPPLRRCRLRDISSETFAKMKMRDTWNPANLQKYLDKYRQSMDGRIRVFPAYTAEEGTAWSTVDGSFSGLEMKAQMFVEYAMAEDRQERWVEVCEGLEMPYMVVEDRKNPEEYRVLDDSRRAQVRRV